ncbi:GNAT family N-acetyltransferase [Sphingomonas sp.]|uniref:GNAT family N-acetyltransferase n=1 Tax=Sphingomonas sp. TaxID=28214 RepID=UPI002BCCBDDF|nr:GNAT family N-acetyltransferase [Sphingomonas sp.]HWK35415.1 GNAT family N-acetyltransferase [Sphingomonas sp.]
MIDYRWADPAELPGIATFFARIVALDESYVSHGEVQTGLSLDGRSWAPDLDARMQEDLAALGPDRSVAVAQDSGRLVAAAIILWEVNDRTSFMVIEDLATDPAVRSHGVGAALLAFVEAEGRRRGMRWAFLESGLHNDGAHRFFEKHGFGALSKVFSKKLG